MKSFEDLQKDLIEASVALQACTTKESASAADKVYMTASDAMREHARGFPEEEEVFVPHDAPILFPNIRPGVLRKIVEDSRWSRYGL
jgi:hypothetical protein